MSRFTVIAAAILFAAAPLTHAAPASPSRQHGREAQNRTLVLRFCEAVYNRRDYAAAEALLAQDFIQHNPKIPTGRRGFLDSYSDVVAHHPGLHSEVIRSSASGDLVWTHVHVTDGSGTYHLALINIFRVLHGKIVEHWDVIQPVPATTANGNTMF